VAGCGHPLSGESRDGTDVNESLNQAAPQAPVPEDLLFAHGITMGFPGVLALDDVQFRLKRGTVHALMGENGAGKSTLMKILAGIYTPDAGEIRLRGVPVTLGSPLDALQRGIAMIHQELNLMAPMTVAENVWIRREPRNRLGLVDHRAMRRMTQTLLEKLNIRLDPDAKVAELSVANRQMVEIAKAVSYKSDVLIMDEPTSALTQKEADHLFAIMRDLRAQGVGIVYITHKMNELFSIADEVSVFRDGRYISTHAANEVTRDDIIRMMVGRELTAMFPKEDVPLGETRLSVKGLTLEGVFTDISFDVRAGEILGVAGLVGSGRSNVAEALFGLTPATAGSIAIDGKVVTIDSPSTAIRHRMAFLTEDRKESGCLLVLDILENMQLAVLHDRSTPMGFLNERRLRTACEAMSRKLRVKTPNLNERIKNLSGGNQQKVLIGRWLLTEPRILILDEPTRGIDVGAKAEIHRLITELARQGVAVVMISSELPEVLGMSDRVMVMHEGRVTGLLGRQDATQVKVMELASR
jgi:inositol transport system ATP-binding protein